MNNPPGILDMWEPLRIDRLTTKHIIAVVGVEMRVTHVGPSARGGDFFDISAVSLMSGGVMSLQADRNYQVYARL